jgi:hypothetical protein
MLAWKCDDNLLIRIFCVERKLLFADCAVLLEQRGAIFQHVTGELIHDLFRRCNRTMGIRVFHQLGDNSVQRFLTKCVITPSPRVRSTEDVPEFTSAAWSA